MVTGVDTFRQFFEGHEDQYAIIGGAACELLFDDAGLDFRATKDIDMVLCVEVVDAAFGARFREFLEAGGYQANERRDGHQEFYRFHKPQDAAFPFMIELFARTPGAIDLPEEIIIAPIPVDEDIISLSAILLDTEYFEALQSAKRVVSGVTLLDETLLIPFKARAFLDLSKRSADGEKVNSKDIKKHRNDVFRLTQLLPGSAQIEVSETIRDDLRRFLDIAENDDALDPKSFKVPLSREEAIGVLRSAYGLA